MDTSLNNQPIPTVQLFLDIVPQLTAFADVSDSSKFMEWADSQRQAQQSILDIFKSPLWLHAIQYRDLEHRLRGKMSVYFGSVNEIRHKPENQKSDGEKIEKLRQEIVFMLQSLTSIPIDLKEKSESSVLIDYIKIRFRDVKSSLDDNLSLSCSEWVFKNNRGSKREL